MNTLGITRLLFDFGLVVLIWMVQLIVYPSFHHYTAENLVHWHQKYTLAITFVVVPLMFGQLITALLQVFAEQHFFTIGSLVLIALVWLSTFIQFVPLHGTIASGAVHKEVLNELVSKNWLRTGLWTVLFLWHFFHFLSSGK